MTYRRAALVLGTCVLTIGCGRSESPDAPDVVATGRTFLGCVAQTGQPDVFLLSVVQARDTQAGSPAGSVIPHDNPAAGAVTYGTDPAAPVGTGGDPSNRPVPSAGTTTGPGTGPTPTTTIETYRLAGTGGLDLAAHVGHTLEVNGSVQELPRDAQPAGQAEGTPRLMGELHIESARSVAENCVR